MRAKRHHHIHFGADTLRQTADLGQITWHVKRAIHRAQNIDPRLGAIFALFLTRHTAFGHAKFGENPCHGSICRFPLIFINCTWQKPLNIGAHWGDTTADHFGN